MVECCFIFYKKRRRLQPPILLTTSLKVGTTQNDRTSRMQTWSLFNCVYAVPKDHLRAHPPGNFPSLLSELHASCVLTRAHVHATIISCLFLTFFFSFSLSFHFSSFPSLLFSFFQVIACRPLVELWLLFYTRGPVHKICAWVGSLGLAGDQG